jgi:hypothetical protein
MKRLVDNISDRKGQIIAAMIVPLFLLTSVFVIPFAAYAEKDETVRATDNIIAYADDVYVVGDATQMDAALALALPGKAITMRLTADIIYPSHLSIYGHTIIFDVGAHTLLLTDGLAVGDHGRIDVIRQPGGALNVKKNLSVPVAGNTTIGWAVSVTDGSNVHVNNISAAFVETTVNTDLSLQAGGVWAQSGSTVVVDGDIEGKAPGFTGSADMARDDGIAMGVTRQIACAVECSDSFVCVNGNVTVKSGGAAYGISGNGTVTVVGDISASGGGMFSFGQSYAISVGGSSTVSVTGIIHGDIHADAGDSVGGHVTVQGDVISNDTVYLPNGIWAWGGSTVSISGNVSVVAPSGDPLLEDDSMTGVYAVTAGNGAHVIIGGNIMVRGHKKRVSAIGINAWGNSEVNVSGSISSIGYVGAGLEASDGSNVLVDGGITVGYLVDGKNSYGVSARDDSTAVVSGDVALYGSGSGVSICQTDGGPSTVVLDGRLTVTKVGDYLRYQNPNQESKLLARNQMTEPTTKAGYNTYMFDANVVWIKKQADDPKPIEPDDGTGSAATIDTDAKQPDDTDSSKLDGNAGFTTSTDFANPGVKLSMAAPTWTGRNISKFVMYSGCVKLKQGTDYTVKVISGSTKKIGIAKIKITGKGKYRGSKTVAVKILPKKPTKLALKAGKKSIKVSWKKVSKSQEVTGYVIQYKLKSAKKWKSKTVKVSYKGKTSASYTIRNLKAKRAYQVRLLTYKKIKSGASKGFYKSLPTKAKPMKTK